MSKTERIITWLAIGVSLLMSVIALCRSLPCVAGLDYMGVIVGILSLLITVLIGWNIYSVVDFNKKKEELIAQEQIVKSLVLQISNGMTANAGVTEQSFASIYLYLITKEEPLSLAYWYLNHALFAILRYSEIERYDVCNALTDALISTVTEPSKIAVRKERITEFLQILSKIQDKGRIDRYTELVRIVSSLKVRQ